jgi:hypothetical protein
MTNLVIERNSLSKMMEEWLKAIGVREEDRLEVVFLPSEVIIRPQSTQHAELDAWLEQATQKYASVLRRLADS